MKLGDLVMLVPALGGSTSRLGIIVEICKGSFARIGYSHCNKRAHIMWNYADHNGHVNFSYETEDALMKVADESR